MPISLRVGIRGSIKMGRAVKINITLPAQEFKEVDAFLDHHFPTPSKLFNYSVSPKSPAALLPIIPSVSSSLNSNPCSLTESGISVKALTHLS